VLQLKPICRLSWLAAIVISACKPADVDLPENAVVSLTLCADSYLHAFPNIESRLAALSWQSRSSLSVTPDHLKSLPQADTDLERAQRWTGATRISSAGGTGTALAQRQAPVHLLTPLSRPLAQKISFKHRVGSLLIRKF